MPYLLHVIRKEMVQIAGVRKADISRYISNTTGRYRPCNTANSIGSQVKLNKSYIASPLAMLGYFA